VTNSKSLSPFSGPLWRRSCGPGAFSPRLRISHAWTVGVETFPPTFFLQFSSTRSFPPFAALLLFFPRGRFHVSNSSSFSGWRPFFFFSSKPCLLIVPVLDSGPVPGFLFSSPPRLPAKLPPRLFFFSLTASDVFSSFSVLFAGWDCPPSTPLLYFLPSHYRVFLFTPPFITPFSS